MPQWLHDRAHHILAKNPDMSKSTAFAVATQQSHAVGKSPKDFGTSKGKHEAKQKYDEPKKEYVKTPDPGKVGKVQEKLEDKGLDIRKEAAVILEGKEASASADVLPIFDAALVGGFSNELQEILGLS